MPLWRWLDHAPRDAAWNMAVDEALWRLCGPHGRPTLRLYAWSPAAVSLGYFQRLEQIDQGVCRAHGFTLVRRPTGGRAVLHDQELTYSLVAPLRCFPDGVSGSYRAIGQAFVHAFAELGVPARLQRAAAYQRSAACFDTPSLAELTVAGRKVMGSAQTRGPHALLQHGSIPLRLDVDRLAAALRLSPRQARWLRRKAVGLQQAAGRTIGVEELKRAVLNGFQRAFDLRWQPAALSREEAALARRLATHKYCRLHWHRLEQGSHAVGR